MNLILEYKGFLDFFRSKKERKSIDKIYNEDLDSIKDLFTDLADSGFSLEYNFLNTKNGEAKLATIEIKIHKDGYQIDDEGITENNIFYLKDVKDVILSSISYLKNELDLELHNVRFKIPFSIQRNMLNIPQYYDIKSLKSLKNFNKHRFFCGVSIQLV